MKSSPGPFRTRSAFPPGRDAITVQHLEGGVQARAQHLLDGLVLDLILPKLGILLVKFLRVEANHVPQDVQVAAGLAQLD